MENEIISHEKPKNEEYKDDLDNYCSKMRECNKASDVCEDCQNNCYCPSHAVEVMTLTEKIDVIRILIEDK